MRKYGTSARRGSGDTAAAIATAARESLRTSFGTKIEQLFAEYRVSLVHIFRPTGGPDPKITDGGRQPAGRVDPT
jgi:hypothetical protein